MADASRVQRDVRKKPPKYRASCDSCNEAKVRCSQTRPSCARCSKNQNRRCVYGVSKRSGKHSSGGSVKIGADARQPATPTSTTEVETPSSSSSTVDPREIVQFFSASSPDPLDILKEQQSHKNWTFDDNLFLPDHCGTPQGAPVNHGLYQYTFGRGNSRMSNIEDHEHSPLDSAFDFKFRSSSHDGSIGGEIPSYTQSNAHCVSCSTSDRQSDGFSITDTCRCNEIIITQLSSLPVLLPDNRCSTFDVELVQFQKALKLCAGVLGCTCPGKDYTSIMTISMLIARIISVFERGGAHAECDDDINVPSLFMTDGTAPKFSVGIYEIEGEDENGLKREVWWMQIRKVESLVAGFKEMVANITRQQVYQDSFEVAAWKSLVFLLEQKAQAVKRDWSAYRSKA